jgi:hypothetical protein
MRHAFLVLLIFLGVSSRLSKAFALDGRLATTSEGQANISLTIPERVEVQVGPVPAGARRGAEQFEVKSNFADPGFKWSLKRVVFVTKDGSTTAKGGSVSPAARTEVFVVVPE